MHGDSPDEEHIDPHGECRAEITALRSRCEGAQQHIGWLKMFIADMGPENWRDLRDRCQDQLEQLSAVRRASTSEDLKDA